MLSFNRSEGLTRSIWQQTIQSVTLCMTRIIGNVAGLNYVCFDDVERRQRVDDTTVTRAGELFVHALCYESNQEADWLWLAMKMVREHERRYCLMQALRINPHSELAVYELVKLPPIPRHIRHISEYVT